MTRAEAVEEIVAGNKLISSNHPFKEDILFFSMLKNAVVEKEWYEVADFCNIRIQHLENKQSVNKLNEDIAYNVSAIKAMSNFV